MSALLPIWEHAAFAVDMAGKYRAEGRNFVREYLAHARRNEADAAVEGSAGYRRYLIDRARFARLAVALVCGARAAAIYQTGGRA